MIRAVLIFDYGRAFGLGHMRRMQSLAAALEGFGVKCELSSTRSVKGAQLLVVDSYETRADSKDLFEAKVIAATDDLNRDLAVDVVIDPAPGASTSDHPSAGKTLVGLDYIMVDPGLDSLRPRPIQPHVQDVLVSLGGTDANDLSSEIARDLTRNLPGVRVLQVVGPWSEAKVPMGVTAVRGIDGIGSVLADSDMVITAGGVTLIETLRLGRPAVAMAIQDNQRKYVEGFAALGSLLAAAPRDAPVTARELASDPAKRRSLSEAAHRLIDGQGAHRVAKELVDFFAN